MRMVVVFDNLVQQHSSGIVGLTQNVQAVCSEDELPRFGETTLRARQAGEEFRRMFQS